MPAAVLCYWECLLDQDRPRYALAPSGAAHLLPCRRDGPGIPDEHGRLQRADVDAELERVRRDHAAHRSIPEPFLDRPPFGWEVSAAIAAHQIGRPLRLRKARAKVG